MNNRNERRELKSQPVDKRTLAKYYPRAAACIVFAAAAGAACWFLAPLAADALGYEKYGKAAAAAALLVDAMLLVRALSRNSIRKWCYAYITYVYDCMEMDSVINCPRCQTAFVRSYSGVESETKSCPNKNCGLSLGDRMTYSQMPSTYETAKALVLNGGVRDDFKHSTFRDVAEFLLSFAVFLASSVFLTFLAAPRLIEALRELF